MTPMNISMPILMDEGGRIIFCDQPLPASYVVMVLKVYGAIACIALLVVAGVLLSGLQCVGAQ